MSFPLIEALATGRVETALKKPLTPAGFRVLLNLALRANDKKLEAWPSLGRLASETNLSRRSATRGLAELIHAELIEFAGYATRRGVRRYSLRPLVARVNGEKRTDLGRTALSTVSSDSGQDCPPRVANPVHPLKVANPVHPLKQDSPVHQKSFKESKNKNERQTYGPSQNDGKTTQEGLRQIREVSGVPEWLKPPQTNGRATSAFREFWRTYPNRAGYEEAVAQWNVLDPSVNLQAMLTQRARQEFDNGRTDFPPLAEWLAENSNGNRQV